MVYKSTSSPVSKFDRYIQYLSITIGYHSGYVFTKFQGLMSFKISLTSGLRLGRILLLILNGIIVYWYTVLLLLLSYLYRRFKTETSLYGKTKNYSVSLVMIWSLGLSFSVQNLIYTIQGLYSLCLFCLWCFLFMKIPF